MEHSNTGWAGEIRTLAERGWSKLIPTREKKNTPERLLFCSNLILDDDTHFITGDDSDVCDVLVMVVVLLV